MGGGQNVLYSYLSMFSCIYSGVLAVHEFRDVHEAFEFSYFLQVVCQEADALYVEFLQYGSRPLVFAFVQFEA